MLSRIKVIVTVTLHPIIYNQTINCICELRKLRLPKRMFDDEYLFNEDTNLA